MWPPLRSLLHNALWIWTLGAACCPLFSAWAVEISFTSHIITQDPDAGGSGADGVANEPTFNMPADIDRDGDMDVVVSAQGAFKVYWFENPGSLSGVWTAHLIGSGSQPRPLDVGDVDNDGDLDVVVGYALGDTVVWYEQGYSGGITWTEHIAPTAANKPRDLDLADVNGNGALDAIVVSEDDDQIAWYDFSGVSIVATILNKDPDGPTPPNTSDNPLQGAANGPNGVAGSDVDLDGDIDIVVASTFNVKIAWWENVGTPSVAASWIEHEIATSAEANFPLFLSPADINRDGWPDVVFAWNSNLTSNRIIYWAENPGTAKAGWTLHEVINQSGTDVFTLTTADLDSDGDLDILRTEFLALGGFFWHENLDGNGSSWAAHTIDISVDRAFVGRAADADGDGDMDLVGTSFGDDRISIEENLSIHRSANYVNSTEIAASLDGPHQVALADIDSDGTLDAVVAASMANRVTWYANTAGDGSAWSATHVVTGYTDAQLVDTGDLDSDGTLDVVAASSAGNTIRLYRNTAGNGTAWTMVSISASGASFDIPQSIEVVDMNHDGAPDVLGAARGSLRVAWFENNGTGASWTRRNVWIPGNGIYPKDASAGDLDGDGDMDIASTDRVLNRVHWHRNDNGLGTSWTTFEIAPQGAASGPEDVAIGDIDGDGVLDVVAMASSTNTVLLYKNTNGDGSAWAASTLSSTVSAAHSLLLHDFDLDGDLDAASTAIGEHKIIWHENTAGDGSAWTDHIVATVASEEPHALALGDIDRDGLEDLCATFLLGDKVRWYPNGGGQFALTTTDIAPTTILPGEGGALLQIDAVHRGRSGDADAEIVTFELLFEEGPGAPLNSSEANAAIETFFVYKDELPAGYNPAEDTLVATIDTLALDAAGRQTVTFSDADPNLLLPYGTPATYFVAVQLTATAGSVAINGIRVTHVTEASSTGEDASNDIPILLEYATNVPSTTTDTGAPPFVASIVRADANPTNDAAVDFTVSFTKSVNAAAVGAGDFELTLSGVTGASITGVTGSEATYTVSVNTGLGDGTIRLDLVDDDSIKDSFNKPLGGFGAGNGTYRTGEAYTLDKTAPTILFSDPSEIATTTGPVSYTVSYGGASSIALTPAAITLNKTGSANGEVTVTGSGALSRTVTLANTTGNGTLAITLAGGTAFDSVGNGAASAGPSVAFIVDNLPPSVTLQTPSVAATNAGPVTFPISYADYDVIVLTQNSVTVETTGTVAVGSKTVTQTGAGVRNAILSNLSGNGTVRIALAAGTAVDSLGNAALAAGPSATVTVDNVAPTTPVISTNGGNGPGVSYSTFRDSVTLEGTVDPSASSLTVNGGTQGLTYTPGGSAWSFQRALALGAATFNFVATDAAGNASAVKSITITRLPPASEVFVDDSATNGNLTGDGTAAHPWQTITFAMGRVAPFATSSNRIKITIEPGTYNEQVVFAPYVTVAGRDPANPAGTIVQYREALTNFRVVTGADTSALANCTVRVDGSVTGNVELLRIENVNMQVQFVVFDGATNTDAVGLLISGVASSATVVRDCTVKRVREGIRVVNSGATISRTEFSNVQRTALLIELPATKAGEILTPKLGSTGDGENTGFNRFRSVAGMFVEYVNDNPAPTSAEFNDWGIDDPNAVKAKVSPQVDVDPIVAKRLGIGQIVVDLTDFDTKQQLSASSNAAITVSGISPAPTREPVSLLFTFPAPSNTYTIQATADEYRSGSRQGTVSGLSVAYVEVPLRSVNSTTPPSDINGDTDVNALDIQLVINRALGLAIGAFSADVNGDGQVNALDIQLVINAALGIGV